MAGQLCAERCGGSTHLLWWVGSSGGWVGHGGGRRMARGPPSRVGSASRGQMALVHEETPLSPVKTRGGTAPTALAGVRAHPLCQAAQLASLLVTTPWSSEARCSTVLTLRAPGCLAGPRVGHPCPAAASLSLPYGVSALCLTLPIFCHAAPPPPSPWVSPSSPPCSFPTGGSVGELSLSSLPQPREGWP